MYLSKSSEFQYELNKVKIILRHNYSYSNTFLCLISGKTWLPLHLQELTQEPRLCCVSRVNGGEFLVYCGSREGSQRSKHTECMKNYP